MPFYHASREIETSSELLSRIKKKLDVDDVEGKAALFPLLESLDDTVLEKKPNTFLEILRPNAPEKRYLVLGCITSALIGGAQAAFVVIYTEIYDDLSITGSPICMSAVDNHSN
eukprot:TsM_000730700 transcript=TsM_000730700 gene=TsM_000730700